MKNKKAEILVLAMFIVIQSIIYVFVGTNKSYIHIDEAYSYGLSNYERVEIQNKEDFFNNWHNKEYYEDYLSVQEDESGNYVPVYENQKNDVHPPLYYLMLRIAMNFTKGHFSKWTGIGLNIVIYAFVTIFMYLILKKLLKNEVHEREKAAILSFVSSIILASISNVIYIRMYALSTLNILITIYLHIKLLENENINIKLLISIGICALAGVLTHYYYLFYLGIIYLIILVKYIKQKKIKHLIYYTLTMIITALMSLVIFPYSIKHMFFGYRGQGVITNLKNIHEIIPSIVAQMYNLNYYVFNNLMYVIFVAIIGIIVYNKIRKRNILKVDNEKKDILKLIYMPTLIFFIITSIASPWKVLRYIVPVCGLIFISVIYILYKLLQSVLSEKLSNILIIMILCIILIAPFIFELEPELMYTDKKEIVQKLEDLNLPTVYLYNSQSGGFLDDILMFSKIEESYVAKDIECTEENIQKILQDKNISQGVFIFINVNQNNDAIIDVAKKALNFVNCEQLNKLTSCDVYYLY